MRTPVRTSILVLTIGAAFAAPAARGAAHSAGSEYALGNLPGNKVFAWTPDDGGTATAPTSSVPSAAPVNVPAVMVRQCNRC